MARDCAQLGGQRQPLIAHMRQLWARVDFMPGEEGGQGMDEEDEVEEAGGLGDTRSALAQTAAAVSVGGDSGNAVDPAQEAEGEILHQTEDTENTLVSSGVPASGEGGSDTSGGPEEEGGSSGNECCE